MEENENGAPKVEEPKPEEPEEKEPEPEPEPKKPFNFSVSETNGDYKNNRFCLATGKAVSDDDKEYRTYNAPKIEDIEDQVVKNTQDIVKDFEGCRNGLNGLEEKFKEKVESLEKERMGLQKEVNDKVAALNKIVKDYEVKTLGALEEKYNNINGEYNASIISAQNLTREVDELIKKTNDVLDQFVERKVNGDVCMIEINKLQKEIEAKTKDIENIKEKVCTEYKIEFRPNEIFDDIFGQLDNEDAILELKKYGEDFIEIKVEDQKGEHEELAYASNDDFPVRCTDEHENERKVYYNEGKNEWYCHECKRENGEKFYKDIIDDKKAEIERICTKLEENCNKLIERNKKNADNEFNFSTDLNSKIEEINKFFADMHKNLEVKRNKLLEDLKTGFKEKYDTINKEHERLRLYLKEGNHLLALARETSKYYGWAEGHTGKSYKPIQQLIVDIKNLNTKSEILSEKIASLESESKKKFMKIEFKHEGEQKIKEGIESISVDVKIVSEQ